MSILIKMEMPKSCSTEACFVRTVSYEDGTVWCPVAKRYLGDQATVCPLVEIPPHGRLIESKAFLQVAHETDDFSLDELAHLAVLVAATPTIIEAEEGES